MTWNLLNNRFISDGGPVQMVLLVLSIICISTIIDEIIFQYKLRKAIKKDLPQNLLTRIFINRISNIKEICKESHQSEKEKILLANQTAMKNIEFLGLISSISPILGVLGTVHGIAVTFFQMSGKEDLQFHDISLGISHALYTTAFGLSICFIALCACWIAEKSMGRTMGSIGLEIKEGN